MAKGYLLNFFLFFLVLFIQIYFGMVLSISPVLNIVLIFLIFTFFYFPLLYLFFLIFLTAIAFDTLSGLFWGMNLFILLISFGVGTLLTRFLEKSHSFSRIIIGESIIFIYFLCLLITNLIFKTPYISFIIFQQFLITSFYVKREKHLLDPEEVLLDRKAEEAREKNLEKLEFPISSFLIKVVFGICLVLFSVIFLRLFYLQIVEGENYQRRAENNRTHYYIIRTISF